MRPQVNLLDDLNENEGGLQPRKLIVLMILGGFIVILATCIQGWYVSQHKIELMERKNQFNNSLEELAKVQQQYPNLSFEEQLEKSNSALKDDITEQKNILSLLDTDNKLQTKGFYRYLLSLSNNAREGIWLTEFELMPGSQKARLKGQTVAPALVPEYISDLSNSEFQGTNFSQLRLSRMIENSKIYDFEFDSSLSNTSTSNTNKAGAN